MKTILVSVSLLTVLASVPAHAVLSCDALFRVHRISPDEQELHALIHELQAILYRTSGPDADKEVDRVLRGDVQKTLVDITNQMRADDRLIDDLLQGRRNLKNQQTLTDFSESLDKYRAIKTGEAHAAGLLGSVLPKLEKRREEELRAAIPRQSALIQSVKAEVERDIDLMKQITATTEAHIEALGRRLALLERLEPKLDSIVPGQSIIEQALVTRMRYEILTHIQDLHDMGRTARASVASMSTVIETSHALNDGISKQLNVVLPRVAAETKTPSLMSSLQSGAQTAALIRSSSDHGALQAYGSSSDFARLSGLVLNAKDLEIASVALDAAVLRQTGELPGLLVKAFSDKKNGIALISRFSMSAKNIQWTISMVEPHTLLLNRLFELKKADKEALANLLEYGKLHEFDTHQNEIILSAFLNRSLPEETRMTAAFLLIEHPHAHMIERLSNALRNESSSTFVESVRTRLELTRKHVVSTDLADSLQRDLDRAEVAKVDAKLGENLSRLEAGLKLVRKQVGKGSTAFSNTASLFLQNPHPEAGRVAMEMAQAITLGNRSVFWSEESSRRISWFSYALETTLNKINLQAPAPSLEIFRKSIVEFKDRSRIQGMKLMLDLVARTPVDGLRELLDQRIAVEKASQFQNVLIVERVARDQFEGPDVLTPMYLSRLNSIVETVLKGDGSYYGQYEYLNQSMAHTLFFSNVVPDDALQMRLLKKVRPGENQKRDVLLLDKIEAVLRARPRDVVEAYIRANVDSYSALSDLAEMGIRLGMKDIFALTNASAVRGSEATEKRAVLIAIWTERGGEKSVTVTPVQVKKGMTWLQKLHKATSDVLSF